MLTVARDNLSDQVARHIRELIRTGSLKPGDSLPSELELATELGVSRAVVREAFRSLAAAGVVLVSSGKRAQVRHLDQHVLRQFLTHAAATEQVLPSQVLEIRRAIEVSAAELAARRASEADIEAMLAALDGMRAADIRSSEFVDYDVQFHAALAAATQNPLFTVLIGALREAIDSSIREGLRSRETEGEMQRIVHVHELVAAAVAARDPVRASRAMDYHFDDAINAILARSARSARSGQAAGGS